MSTEHAVSAELLNAFVDDELSLQERDQVMEALEASPQLKQEACEIGALKNMVHHAYAQATPPSRVRQTTPGKRTWHGALAACCILAIGTAVGWYAHLFSQIGATTPIALAQHDHSALVSNAVHAQKVLLHIDSNDPAAMKSSLDEAEHMLKTAQQKHTDFRLAILANNSGLDLLRQDKSPYTARIQALQAQFNNLELLACKQSLERAQKRDGTVRLIPGVQHNHTAIETLTSRLPEGWNYIRIESGGVPARPRLG